MKTRWKKTIEMKIDINSIVCLAALFAWDGLKASLVASFACACSSQVRGYVKLSNNMHQPSNDSFVPYEGERREAFPASLLISHPGNHIAGTIPGRSRCLVVQGQDFRRKKGFTVLGVVPPSLPTGLEQGSLSLPTQSI